MIADICENPGMLRTISIFSIGIKIIFIAIPMVLVLKVTIDLFKNIFGNPENKKKLSTIFMRFVSAMAIFLVPTFVKLFMNLFVSGTDNILNTYNTCLENVNNINYYETKRDALANKEDEASSKESLKKFADNKLTLDIVKSNEENSKIKSSKPNASANNYKVLINPSHQIHNETISSNKNYSTEKLSMYILADKVKSELKSRGYEVYLDAYNGDSKLQTRQITKLISESNAKNEEVVYIALHSNANPNSKSKLALYGPQAYYASSNSNSKKFSESMCNELYKVYNDNGLKPSSSVSKCSLTTTRISEPRRFYDGGGKGAAILIEIGYHDNKRNQTFIENSGEKLAKGVANGIDSYLGL